MSTAIQLDPSTVEALDAAVASGRFLSRDDAIRTALYIVQESDAAGDDGPLTEREIAALERSIAQADAGMLIPIEDVRADMRRRFASRA